MAKDQTPHACRRANKCMNDTASVAPSNSCFDDNDQEIYPKRYLLIKYRFCFKFGVAKSHTLRTKLEQGISSFELKALSPAQWRYQYQPMRREKRICEDTLPRALAQIFDDGAKINKYIAVFNHGRKSANQRTPAKICQKPDIWWSWRNRRSCCAGEWVVKAPRFSLFLSQCWEAPLAGMNHVSNIF